MLMSIAGIVVIQHAIVHPVYTGSIYTQRSGMTMIPIHW